MLQIKKRLAEIKLREFSKTLCINLFILGTAFLISGCEAVRRALENTEQRVIVLEPVKTAAVQQSSWNNFGICHFRLERRVSFSHLGGAFYNYEDAESLYGQVGHEIRVIRGESCHLRTVFLFQTALAFDLSALPEGGIVRARLKMDRLNYYGVDPDIRFGFSLCEPVSRHIERATRDWEPAPRSESEPNIPRMLLSAIPSTAPRINFSSRTAAEGYDVTETVRSWVKGDSPNFGFVITPDAGEVGHQANGVNDLDDQLMCNTMIRNAQLEVTMLVRR